MVMALLSGGSAGMGCKSSRKPVPAMTQSYGPGLPDTGFCVTEVNGSLRSKSLRALGMFFGTTPT